MFEPRLNRTEVSVLSLLAVSDMSLSELAEELPASLSWTSECVSRLASMGFLKTRREGNVVVSFSQESPGRELRVLFREGPMLDRHAVLVDSSLKILPHLVPPGRSSREIIDRTGLSSATVKNKLARWRRMGVVNLKKKTYAILPTHAVLAAFARAWAAHVNAVKLSEAVPDGIILWQSGDEFMFATDASVAGFQSAGPTRLQELSFDIASESAYFFSSPLENEISEDEAITQTILIDPANPRPRRLAERVDPEKMLEMARKYGIEELLKERR